MQGEDDEYATMRQIEVIAEQVQGAELLKLPNCGHSPQRDQENVVLEAISRFVGPLALPQACVN
jgi:pimeloyl-ACP methyl ester carboxylesterase